MSSPGASDTLRCCFLILRPADVWLALGANLPVDQQPVKPGLRLPGDPVQTPDALRPFMVAVILRTRSHVQLESL